MTIKEILKKLQEQEPTAQLIPSSHTEAYLVPYQENALGFDSYYMGIKYATLAFAGDSFSDLSSLVDTAIKIYSYKWDKLYKTLSLTYDPIANVDAEIIETRDIASRHMEDTMGAQSATSTNGQAPMESSSYHNVSENKTDSDEYVNEHDEDAYIDEITTTRKGNIGVTSSQQLIQAERDVAVFQYIDVVMRDIMDIIAMPYFE